MSTPPDNRENEAERQNDGLRDEIEEILRESGEKPVLPRPPRPRGGGTINNLAGMVRNMGAGSVAPRTGSFMRTAMILLLLRVALGVVFAFIAVRILGPRAILLLIVITLAVLALITVRYMIARRRYSR